MKKAIIKGTVIGLVFIAALLAISLIANQGNNDLTVEMGEATYPLVYMEKDGICYNTLHGYSKAMNTAFQKDTITVLDEGRSVDARIDTYGRSVEKIRYEVRNVDGTRLIEDGEIQDYEQNGEQVRIHFSLKDLIESDTQYCLVFLLSTDGAEDIRYYTGIVWPKEYYVAEKLEFVRYFHELTFQDTPSRELSKYLESNAEGDNSTFSKVDIHSSLSQVCWGELEMEKLSEPVPSITDIDAQTARITQEYFVSTGSGSSKRTHRVKEYYRIRYTTDRVYLLEFERTMEQVLDSEKPGFVDNKLDLGVVDPETTFTESEDGNILVFENQGRLFSYNVTDNKCAVLFSFFDRENGDPRTLYNRHAIKILNVDEAGNIDFAVYGYMNRGRHEGDVGIQLYYYNATVNTLEEVIYIPYDKAADVLMCELKDFLYMNRENSLFFALDGSVYAVDLQEKAYSVLTEDVNDGALQVSKNGKMAVWQKGQDLYSCQELELMDLSSGNRLNITAAAEEYILPLGFIEEDLVYGLAERKDIYRDSAGKTVFPMYVVYIQNGAGEVLKEYRQPSTYITGCNITGNQVVLFRMERDEEGRYSRIQDDQIMNSESESTGKNVMEVINAGVYEKQVRIVLKNKVDVKGLKVLTPKEVLFEGGRELYFEEKDSHRNRYYVYGFDGAEWIYMNPANAINTAYEMAGVVTGDRGECIFRKGSRSGRNQIMAIGAENVTEEKNSVAVCLDTILEFNGVVRNTQLQLQQGESVPQILQGALPDYQVLDLTGCSLDAVLFYVNRDIPVMALQADGSAVLITGFNELQIVIMDPISGTLYKKGIHEAADWFEQNGNYFITYYRE